MKKQILVLIFIVTILLAAGCSRSTKTSVEKTPATGQTTQTEVTKDKVKDLSDDQLLKMAQEPTSDIDNLDLEDSDLSELDSILNNKDLTSDVPTSVDLKK